ncbi:NACHT domain-containing protein [Paractinoplanes durhamensis]|uniref:AAA+ ATPase domain-containing protein n=1 Tax=Paractinoplanes durhamensis TaxID=113563 RepID=A0ABQ3ZDQ6_9ACTN|nr:AAA family ATPase [Actinoplanes durhamensis]GIE07993.1 hypothetical protein Adu01nite_93430 [Actinoplanes durhamensis]
MPKGLSYADAVKILGGAGPLAKTADNLLGGLLSVATAGGSEAALSFFDAKAEMVRLGGLVTSKITDIVRGLGRYNRSERLLAASGVLVVASLFEALDECLSAAGLEPAEFGKDDQLLALGSRPGLDSLFNGPIPRPTPDSSYRDLLDRVRAWAVNLSGSLALHVSGLAVWDAADGTTRIRFVEQMGNTLGTRTAERYDEYHRRLAVDVPEFAIWAGSLEARATAQSLQRLENLLTRTSAGRDPSRHRAALSRAYRAKLTRPVLDGGDLVLPDLGDIYVDPRFQVKVAAPGAAPSLEAWWDSPVRDDIHAFLATYLTTTDATVTPMLLLGQPGAGKSSLTHIVAARLPAYDYLVARVPLREVPAEADIQDQIELAIRSAIGETVAWAQMAEDAERPLSVVLLDGFDELLQATGLHQSDYLQRVAAFQERELAQNRPVAVIVTSRVAVADRARVPQGSLVVRLEPFSGRQIKQWLDVWNTTNPSAEPLLLKSLIRFPDLAGQPLLLLMLALYHAGGNPLSDRFDSAQLYERLLTEFAGREVRRVHAGRPDHTMPALIQAELLRLSVVAFAMFHRNRLWVTERELDDDLAGLGLTPSRAADTEGFRTPLTAAQEMVGRFFFIQHAQALRDGRTLQTYEFLHATFGEYLVARLVVQALRDTTARENAGTMELPRGRQPEADLLQDLLGYTPLTTRNTVLQFVRSLLNTPDRPSIREFLVRRTRQAVARPQYTPSSYRPIDKRIDHWMAVYSFNLVMLTLACGGELRATDLFTQAKDPADWLQGSALQWRAAVPGGIWLESLEDLTVRREVHDGRRDIVLSADGDADVDPLDPAWSNRMRPRERGGAGGYPGNFSWGPALTSMQLSNNLSDDTLLHAMEPIVFRLPNAARYYVVHEQGETESIARSLIEVWLASAGPADPETLAGTYHRATHALSGFEQVDRPDIAGMLIRSLHNDADRMAPGFVVDLLGRLIHFLDPGAAAFSVAVQTLVTPHVRNAGDERLNVLTTIFFALAEAVIIDAEQTESESALRTVREAMARLSEAGDLWAVLRPSRDELAASNFRFLAPEVQANYPHLAHLFD